MDAPAPLKPLRRWHQRRTLRYLAVLLAVCVIGYFSWDALFMPADLRRLQGNWKVVRELTRGKEEKGGFSFDRLVITRHSLEVVEGDTVTSCPFYMVSERRELVAYEPHETKVFGIAFRLPIWLSRPKDSDVEVLFYDLGDHLVLRWPGEVGEIHLVRID